MSRSWVQFPLIYNLDARVHLRQLSQESGRTITLAEVPDAEIEKWSASHFDAIWLFGVWETSKQSRLIAQNNLHMTDESTTLVPDWKSDDILGSPY